MGLGLFEVLILLIVGLVIFGPSRLPKLGQSVGEAIRGFKQGIAGLNSSASDSESSKEVKSHYSENGEKGDSTEKN